LYSPYRKNTRELISRDAAQSELDAKMADFYSRGGTITKCAPGPSEGITLKKTGRMHGRPRTVANTAGTPEVPAEKSEG
jgi:hypothetical protein